MNQSWQTALKQSFEANSAFGVLIDFQQQYFDHTTVGAFYNGLTLTETFREKGISPLWVCWPEWARAPLKGSYAELKEQGVFKPKWHQGIEFFQKIGVVDPKSIDDFAITMPEAHEIVFTKQHMSALTNSEAKAFIKEQRKATYIVAGVLADQCYGSSVKDILDASDCDVIVPYDASNFESMEEAKELFEEPKKLFFPRKGRCHITTTEEVVDYLLDLNAA